MRSKLARTLLILGSVGACERARPVVDARARPAVGNIGQAGRPAEAPRPAAIARPVVEPVVALPVPKAKTPRRVQRVQRAATRVPVVMKVPAPMSIQTSAETRAAYETPLRDRRERPAHANMGRRSSMEPSEEPVEVHEAMHEDAR